MNIQSKLGYDDSFDWELQENWRSAIIERMKANIESMHWKSLPSPEAKIYYCLWLQIIRKLSIRYNESFVPSHQHNFTFSAIETLAIHRFVQSWLMLNTHQDGKDPHPMFGFFMSLDAELTESL